MPDTWWDGQGMCAMYFHEGPVTGQRGGQIDTTMNMVLRPGEALTYNALTIPAWRGRGVNPHLSQFALHCAMQHGARRRINWRRLGNAPAMRVAAKLGDRLFAVVTTVRVLGVEQALVFGTHSARLLPLLQCA
jgi:GNAT superfamily N-acetyltransferase